jgi:predicted DCC family thiol-disulfide oxidoreductase YuxK
MDMEASSFEIEVFFDGKCPLCTREIALLRKLDRGRRIRFTDIAEPAFDPAGIGVSMQTLMARIHGRLPDGTLVEGVEVFRRVYDAVGLRFIATVTRWPGVALLAELAYSVFARNRLRLTRRCDEAGCAPP